MKRYWIKYRPLTGLGSPVKTAWFDTIEERWSFYRSGVQVVGFGQRGLVMDTFEVWWEKNCRLDKNSSREIWQASRENQQEYQKHEFCRDMNCSYLKKDKCELKPGCCNSARGFHLWLKENGYRIVRITSGSG